MTLCWKYVCPPAVLLPLYSSTTHRVGISVVARMYISEWNDDQDVTTSILYNSKHGSKRRDHIIICNKIDHTRIQKALSLPRPTSYNKQELRRSIALSLLSFPLRGSIYLRWPHPPEALSFPGSHSVAPAIPHDGRRAPMSLKSFLSASVSVISGQKIPPFLAGANPSSLFRAFCVFF